MTAQGARGGSGRRLKNGVIYLLLRGLVALLSWTPRRMVVPLGRFLGRCARVFARRERQRALDNIAASSLALSREEHGALVREVFANLGASVIEALVLQRLQSRLVGEQPWVEIPAAAQLVLQRAAERGRGVVFVTAHVGNFELLAAAIAQLHGTVHVLARRSYDPRLTRLLERRRQRCGVEPLWVDDRHHLLATLRVLRAGGWVGVLLDQPVRGAPEVPFFGRSAPTSTLAARLQRSQGASLLVGFLRRGMSPKGLPTHQLTVEEIEPTEGIDDLTLTAALTTRIEDEVRARPVDWLWTLDRWRGEVAEGGAAERAAHG